MNMIHDQHVYHKWHVFVILFFMSCPEPPMSKSGVGSSPVQSGGSPIKFSSSSRCRELALTRETSYIFEFLLGVVGSYAGGCQASGYVWLFVHWGPSMHPPCVHTHPIYLFIALYIKGTSRQTFCTSVCQAFLCLSVHPFVHKFINCLSALYITVGLSYQLINIVGHLQSQVWLAWVPVYSGYCFYCFVPVCLNWRPMDVCSG